MIPLTFITNFNRNNGIRTVHIENPAAFTQLKDDLTPNRTNLQLPTIFLPSTVEVQLIRSQVTSSILATELINIWHDNILLLQQLDPNHRITAYTDGSLSSKHVRRDRSRSDNISMMGSGWFIVQNNRRFDCGSQLWPSSTKAELIAIWTFLLTCPINSSIRIITDSQAAIDGITNHFTIPTVRLYLKSTNSPILDAIRHSTTVKNLKVDYVKVKSHSGDSGNDLADDIAKSAITRAESNQDRIIETSNLSTHRLAFQPFSDLLVGMATSEKAYQLLWVL